MKGYMLFLINTAGFITFRVQHSPIFWRERERGFVVRPLNYLHSNDLEAKHDPKQSYCHIYVMFNFDNLEIGI